MYLRALPLENASRYLFPTVRTDCDVLLAPGSHLANALPGGAMHNPFAAIIGMLANGAIFGTVIFSTISPLRLSRKGVADSPFEEEVYGYVPDLFLVEGRIEVPNAKLGVDRALAVYGLSKIAVTTGSTGTVLLHIHTTVTRRLRSDAID